MLNIWTDFIITTKQPFHFISIYKEQTSTKFNFFFGNLVNHGHNYRRTELTQGPKTHCIFTI
jgi:hypothetical protein